MDENSKKKKKKKIQWEMSMYESDPRNKYLISLGKLFIGKVILYRMIICLNLNS